MLGYDLASTAMIPDGQKAYPSVVRPCSSAILQWKGEGTRPRKEVRCLARASRLRFLQGVSCAASPSPNLTHEAGSVSRGPVLNCIPLGQECVLSILAPSPEPDLWLLRSHPGWILPSPPLGKQWRVFCSRCGGWPGTTCCVPPPPVPASI